jgi:transaldolase
MMPSTRALHDMGQSLWLDNITRTILDDGTLQHYIDDLSVTGLTSNPTIFDHAIRKSGDYDDSIRRLTRRNRSEEVLFFELALEDLRRAADLFRSVYERTAGMDGWVSLEVSPLLAYDARLTIEQARRLHEQAERPNVLIKIPGTAEGLIAIEECIFAGVPVNVTLLFSREQYLSAAGAYIRGLERRIVAGQSPDVRSVASMFISRWDKKIAGQVPAHLKNRLGLGIGRQTYPAYLELLASPRWLALANAGARPQRLLWGSTSTKDPEASDVLYVEGLAAPFTINTMPDETLQAFADHGHAVNSLPADGGDVAELLAQFREAGVDTTAVAAQLQREGADAFSKSWRDLMACIGEKRGTLTAAGR